MNPLLHTRALSAGHDTRVVLKDVDADLHEGELVALIGVNGSGKSTLLRTLAGLRAPLSGEVLIKGEPLASMSTAQRARMISVVLTGKPRGGMLDVYTLVSLGRQPWTGRLGRLNEDDHRKVQEAMERTGISRFAERSIHSLSDGESQMVMIARALAQDTPLMLLDEPTAFLDLVNRVKVMKLLRTIVHDTGKAALISTHDLHTAMEFSDRLMIIGGEGIWMGSPRAAIQEGILRMAFAEAGDMLFPTAST